MEAGARLQVRDIRRVAIKTVWLLGVACHGGGLKGEAINRVSEAS